MVRARAFDILWLLAFGLASSVWCVNAATRLGATFDEPHHLNAGLTAWRTGSNKLLMSAGCMPLPVDVQTLPIYLWEQFRDEEFHQYKDIETILPVARATNLVFWWVLLVYAMRLGRTFGGAWGGRLAVALVACDPNFLGHACLATTDISVVACLLALIYHFHHGQGRGWSWRVLVPGLCYGLATVAKASGMVFGAQAMLVIGLYRLASTGALAAPTDTSRFGKVVHLWHASFALRRDLVGIAVVGFALVFAYCGSDWGTEPTFIDWAEKLPEGPVKTAMDPLSRNLAIFPNAGEALVQQVKHNMRGHGTYLLGEWYPRAYWGYFPIALSMKTPLPVLVLLAGVLLLCPRHLNTPLGWVALALLAFSLNCRVQIGIRFMFTLMAVAEIAIAVAIARSWRESRLAIPRWLVGGLLASTAAVSLWVWPNGLSYFNQAWGGPEAGSELLHDSNTDWGQGLPELKQWHATHGDGRPLAVWYYGADPAILYPPFHWVPLSHLPLASGDDVKKLSGDGYLAVSIGVLHGDTGITPSTRIATDWLKTREPVARTHTFAIYDMRQK